MLSEERTILILISLFTAGVETVCISLVYILGWVALASYAVGMDMLGRPHLRALWPVTRWGWACPDARISVSLERLPPYFPLTLRYPLRSLSTYFWRFEQDLAIDIQYSSYQVLPAATLGVGWPDGRCRVIIP